MTASFLSVASTSKIMAWGMRVLNSSDWIPLCPHFYIGALKNDEAESITSYPAISYAQIITNPCHFFF
jgi:hypothetical protein